ncbi:unnamed protein product [Angiostrongylus costaricensis]|uniref:Uncharacterized protein n=1 Tax=Angiostrongylus costaricensis TaxID=334426 RepID=A0A0R3PEF5_ANGCS|nr:unnamed protein product [Angiostrongylus costaricensis]
MNDNRREGAVSNWILRDVKRTARKPLGVLHENPRREGQRQVMQLVQVTHFIESESNNNIPFKSGWREHNL